MLFPLVLLALNFFGVSLNFGSILLMLLGTQWYLLFNVIAGAMAIPSDLREAGTSFHVVGWQRFVTIYLPGVFPYLVTGWVTAAGVLEREHRRRIHRVRRQDVPRGRAGEPDRHRLRPEELRSPVRRGPDHGHRRGRVQPNGLAAALPPRRNSILPEQVRRRCNSPAPIRSFPLRPRRSSASAAAFATTSRSPAARRSASSPASTSRSGPGDRRSARPVRLRQVDDPPHPRGAHQADRRDRPLSQPAARRPQSGRQHRVSELRPLSVVHRRREHRGGAEALKLPRDEITSRTEKVLAMVGLGGFEGAYPRSCRAA